MPALRAGMPWRRFSALLVGLSPESMWRRVSSSQPIELVGEQAQSFINTL
ncbi:hypothetical protein [Microtetraspora niveoalba]|nr:hypothetical protein [Microtetraspora niveoalba]